MSKNTLKLWNCNPKNDNTDSENSWTCVENTKENFQNSESSDDSSILESLNKFKTQIYGTGSNADYYFYGSIVLLILFLFLLFK
jgi:hypothetical protein